jgi:hypothetical protein
MSQRIDPDLFADDLLDADLPIDEWTLDELERSADLGSLRSAWASANDQNE